MDQVRQIRFLIPPFILFVSLIWGVFWSDPNHILWSEFLGSNLLAKVGILLTSTLPAGYLIGLFKVFILKFLFCRSPHSYECHISIETLKLMSQEANISFNEDKFEAYNNKDRKRIEHFTQVMFDHGLIYNKYKGVHEWMVRRWSSFNISIDSVIALLLALIFGLIFKIHLSIVWIAFSVILCLGFIVMAYWSYNDTMKMNEFQAKYFRIV